MPRTMFDAITPSLIPDGPPMVAGYVNGSWPSHAELLTRFPAAVHVSIAVNTTADAQVLDCETGDATPDECPGWAARQTARGQTPTIYCNVSTWPAVVAAFTAQGVPVPLWWAAQYDDTARMYPGAVAKQHTNTPGYDVSIVADHWPGVDPAPTPAPAPPVTAPAPPQPKDDPLMVLFNVPGAAIWLYEPQTGFYTHVPQPSDVTALVAVGARLDPNGSPITQELHDALVNRSAR
jgi:hypothetical protein